jgi:hypothetical protein
MISLSNNKKRNTETSICAFKSNPQWLNVIWQQRYACGMQAWGTQKLQRHQQANMRSAHNAARCWNPSE